MNIFDVFKSENAELLDIARKFEDTTAHQPQERKRLLSLVHKLLQRHRRLEEDYLYPVLDAIPNTWNLVEKSRQENRSIDSIARELYETAPEIPDYQHGIERLNSEILTHIDREEKELVPALQKVLPAEEAEILGQRVLEEVKP